MDIYGYEWTPIKRPFSPGPGSPPPELMGRDPVLPQAGVLLGCATSGAKGLGPVTSTKALPPNPVILSDAKDLATTGPRSESGTGIKSPPDLYMSAAICIEIIAFLYTSCRIWKASSQSCAANEMPSSLQLRMEFNRRFVAKTARQGFPWSFCLGK